MKTSGILVKIASLALVLCMILSLASCDLIQNLFGGSLELVSFTVDRSSVKTEYYIGEEIDFTGIRAIIKYSDEALNKELTSVDLKINYPRDITATVGQKEVTVSYDDPELDTTQETTVTIVVTKDPNVVEHASYRVDATNVKTSYYLGETIDLAGLKLFDVMSNKTEVEITDLTGLTYNVTGLTATAGRHDVTFTYNGESAGVVTFRVIDPEEEKNHVLNATIATFCKTTYDKGDTLDLTGLTVTVTYEEGEPQTVSTGFTAATVDMTTTGTKQVRITFLDPINNEEEYVTLTITVINRSKVMQFEKPQALKNFESSNATATTNPEATGFYGYFSLGDQTYLIGDDNEFEFAPKMAALVDGSLQEMTSYYMSVKIEVMVGSEFVELTSVALTETKHAYSLNDELIVTVDTFNGRYKFEKPIDGVRITVTPHAAHYINDKAPVTLVANVIDAFNVHNSKQLSVIDNDNYRGDWVDLKTSWGLAGINPNGVVLHNDIKITYQSVPESFFYTSDHTVTYYNTITGETKNYAETAGMRYLKDYTFLYVRHGYSDFTINGNFCKIDVSDFPLVASPSIFGPAAEKDYKSDFSNAALFCFEGVSKRSLGDYDFISALPTGARSPEYLIKNLCLDGNAGTDSWVVRKVDGANTTEAYELVTAGGLNMAKSARFAHTTFENVVNKCFMVSYTAEWTGYLNLKNVKCSDSYQNAVGAWSNSDINMVDTYLNLTGGPVIMATSVDWEDRDGTVYHQYPNITITGGNVANSISGQEAWFKNIDPTNTKVGEIQALGVGLNAYLSYVTGGQVTATWVNDGKMNMKGLLLSNGASIEAMLGNINAEGTIMINGAGINRVQEGGTSPWAQILDYIMRDLSTAAQKEASPYITVEKGGVAYTICYVPTSATEGYFVDLNGNQVMPGSDYHTALLDAFNTADQAVLYQGGMSIMLELYH